MEPKAAGLRRSKKKAARRVAILLVHIKTVLNVLILLDWLLCNIDRTDFTRKSSLEIVLTEKDN